MGRSHNLAIVIAAVGLPRAPLAALAVRLNRAAAEPGIANGG